MPTPAAAPTPPFHPAPARSRLVAVLTRRRNPLWRRTDVQRGRLRALLVLVVLVAAPLSVLFGLHLYQADRDAAQRSAAQLQRTQAVVLDPARQPGSPGADYRAHVRWTDTAGAEHQALASVPDTTGVGESVTVWLDARGRPSTAPPAVADSAGKSVFLGVLLLVGPGALAVSGYVLARARLNRVDLRNWEKEWEQVAPGWTGQY